MSSKQRLDVWNGVRKKTSGGLLKKDLIKNKRGRIVSLKKSLQAADQNNLGSWLVDKGAKMKKSEMLRNKSKPPAEKPDLGKPPKPQPPAPKKSKASPATKAPKKKKLKAAPKKAATTAVPKKKAVTKAAPKKAAKAKKTGAPKAQKKPKIVP